MRYSFFNEISRIASPDYLPDESDILRSRTKRSGIYETQINLGQLSIHMIDVSGQRSELKKWIHCFENITTIVYVVDLDTYDEVSLEEPSHNRMIESLHMFDAVVNSRWFSRSSVVLFLNNVDIFKRKLERSPLGDSFPDYTGGNDVNKALQYIVGRFNGRNRAHLPLFPHQARISDASNIQIIIAAVRDSIITNVTKDIGLAY
jgi:guanine nucleotide-binding protein subunit alpha